MGLTDSEGRGWSTDHLLERATWWGAWISQICQVKKNLKTSIVMTPFEFAKSVR